jgi:hypothetical protein
MVDQVAFRGSAFSCLFSSLNAEVFTLLTPLLYSSLSFEIMVLVLIETQASCGLRTGMIFRGLSFR